MYQNKAFEYTIFTPSQVASILRKKFKATECTELEKTQLLYANPFDSVQRLAYKLTDVDLLNSFRCKYEITKNEKIREEYMLECKDADITPLPEFLIIIIDYDEFERISYSVITHYGQTSVPKYLQEELQIFKGNNYSSWKDYEIWLKYNSDELCHIVKKLKESYSELLLNHGYKERL